MNLLQIVPRLPPSICGVGDYSWLLARALREQHGIETRFLVVDPSWQPADGESEFSFERVAADRRGATNQIERLAQSCDAVLLQYSGYGFAKRGAPLWLLAALRALRLRRPRLRLITMFHELYATGPFFRSSFWFSHAQRWITRSIARLSHCAHTNRQASARWLEAAAPSLRGRITAMPVFSNLGEDSQPLPPSQRPNRLLLFQPPPYDSPMERPFWITWSKVNQMLEPTETVIAGRSSALPPSSQFNRVGILSSADASTLFSKSRYCLMDYYDGYLGKSGIFAAIASHGSACILSKSNHSEDEGLAEGRHYVMASDAGCYREPKILNRIASSGWGWYQSHSIQHTAASYAEHLDLSCS